MCALDAQQQTQVQGELVQGEDGDRSVALDHGGLLGSHDGNRNRSRGSRSTPPGRRRMTSSTGGRIFPPLGVESRTTPHRPISATPLWS